VETKPKTVKAIAEVVVPRPPTTPEPESTPKPHVETVDELYAAAEAAMHADDEATAQARLTDVVRRFPSDPLADSALYELARLAVKQKARARARGYLDELLARGGDPAMREPARFLRCRLDVDAGSANAGSCLAAFRRDFVSSPHDAEALALLIGLTEVAGGCAKAGPLLEDYLRLYPAGPFAGEAALRLQRCRP